MSEAAGGHLATITSKDEHAFVMQLCRDAKVGPHCSIGFEMKGGAPAWVTGEPWADQPYCPVVSTGGGDRGGLALRDDWATVKIGNLLLRGIDPWPFIIEWER